MDRAQHDLRVEVKDEMITWFRANEGARVALIRAMHKATDTRGADKEQRRFGPFVYFEGPKGGTLYRFNNVVYSAGISVKALVRAMKNRHILPS